MAYLLSELIVNVRVCLSEGFDVPLEGLFNDLNYLAFACGLAGDLLGCKLVVNCHILGFQVNLIDTIFLTRNNHSLKVSDAFPQLAIASLNEVLDHLDPVDDDLFENALSLLKLEHLAGLLHWLPWFSLLLGRFGVDTGAAD